MWREMEEVQFTLRLSTAVEYTVADLGALFGELGGRLMEPDGYEDVRCRLRPGVYQVTSETVHVFAELPLHRVPDARKALRVAFVGKDVRATEDEPERSVVAGVDARPAPGGGLGPGPGRLEVR